MAGEYTFLARSFAVWLLIIAAETMNGAIREIFITPVVGFHVGEQISFASAIVLIAVITFYLIRWIGATELRRLVVVGLLWAGLTFAFEVILSIAFAGLNWEQIIADFNPFSGGLMSYGLAYLLVIPAITFSIQAVFNSAIRRRSKTELFQR